MVGIGQIDTQTVPMGHSDPLECIWIEVEFFLEFRLPNGMIGLSAGGLVAKDAD